MTQPFTYRIKFIPTGEFYYGVRYKKNCKPSDLWTKYFTSSSLVKKLIDEYGKDQFTFEIRKIFENPESARDWEYRVNKHTRKWPNYLNRTDAKSVGNQFGKKGGLVGGKVSSARKVGIHAEEHLQLKTVYSSLGGHASKEQKTGVHDPLRPWLNDPTKIQNMKSGNSKGGCKTGLMPWWNNGLKNTKSHECPGPEWQPGMISRGHYWNNGFEQIVSGVCPGEGWVRGGIGSTNTGLTFWNNGVVQKMFIDPPDSSWSKGLLKGIMTWWNNGETQCRQKDCPGPEWKKGMLKI